MRDFPSCFGENGVQVADASCSSADSVGVMSKALQNCVSSVYKCRLQGKPCFITILWSKTLMGQSLTVEIDGGAHHLRSNCKVDVKPSLFSKRKGSTSLQLISSSKIELFWDLSLAKFGHGPEPIEGYYIAVVSKGEMVLVIGDLKKEAFKKTQSKSSLSSPLFISKKEHLYGKKSYCTKAQFFDNGPIHNLKIEYCDADSVDDPYLVIRVDAKTVVKVKHLNWKFRGNNTVVIDGLQVEVFWDVHDWLFGSNPASAVLMFQTSFSAEKMWMGPSPSPMISDSSSSSSVFSCNFSESFKESTKISGLGFTLLLYVWKE